jgi:hypothetical protein
MNPSDPGAKIPSRPVREKRARLRSEEGGSPRAGRGRRRSPLAVAGTLEIAAGGRRRRCRGRGRGMGSEKKGERLGRFGHDTESVSRQKKGRLRLAFRAPPVSQ